MWRQGWAPQLAPLRLTESNQPIMATHIEWQQEIHSISTRILCIEDTRTHRRNSLQTSRYFTHAMAYISRPHTHGTSILRCTTENRLRRQGSTPLMAPLRLARVVTVIAPSGHTKHDCTFRVLEMEPLLIRTAIGRRQSSSPIVQDFVTLSRRHERKMIEGRGRGVTRSGPATDCANSLNPNP